MSVAVAASVAGAFLPASPAAGASLESVAEAQEIATRVLESASESETLLTERATLSANRARMPALPAGASDFLTDIFPQIAAVSDAGTVPTRLIASSNNLASNHVAVDPKEIFLRYAELIRSASSDVSLQTFAWDIDSEPVAEVMKALVDVQNARIATGESGPPLAVRFLIDAMDIPLNGNSPSCRLMATLVKRAETLGLDPAHVKIESAVHRHALVGSLHSKSLVVDGVRAIVTGANMNLNDNFDDGEHDAAFEVGGEVARALLADFDDAWLRSEVWVGGTKLPRPPEKGYSRTKPDVFFVRPERIQHTVARLPAPGAPVPMLVLGKLPIENLFSSRDTRNPLDRAVVAAMRRAEHLIRAHTPNFNDDDFLAELKSALRRGVRVELVHAKDYEDLAEGAPMQGGTNSSVIEALFEELSDEPEALARLRLLEYVHTGTEPIEGNSPHASHVKAMVFDDRVILVTSMNMDTQSWNHSREIGVLIDDPGITKAWVEALLRPDAARAHLVRPERE
ncbi:MAG: phosphatidylserine/phosphatidylglycerophosphate/cardiolipin synthase family protein [Deltaproteobacteria bacterium]|nr:phosphatidylserine/phosphatidylglycerophosphate/cardiolipin synthase family protein [Deltaproteobacteria bacterium]